MVLESWYDSRRKIHEVSGAIPGNSQLGVAGITNSPEGGYGGPGGLVFHQTRAEDGPRWPGITLEQCRSGPRGLVLHQGGIGEVLEAWFYTRVVQEWSWRPGIPPGHCRRSPRGLVLHQDGWDRCGPRLPVATTAWIPTAARGVDLQGAVFNTGVAWVTAATGILVYWYF